MMKAPYSQYTSLRSLFYRPKHFYSIGRHTRHSQLFVIPAKAGIHFFILLTFLVNTLGPFPTAQAQEFKLPMPGVMVRMSPPLDPPMLKGIKVHPDNPFQFDFILDQGDNYQNPSVIASEGPHTGHSQLLRNQSLSTVIPAKAGIHNQEQLKQEATKLIKYFLAGLTIPEKDLWVNLSPYEKDRIIPQSFGLTEMGRDLLAEDYMLKQITASLIYPEDAIGKKFWKRIYEEAAKRYGTTNIPVNTFNKVWIVPEKAVVYENAKAGTAYVVESKLKVMLEQDYLALEKNQAPTRGHVAEAPIGDRNVSRAPASVRQEDPSSLPSNEALNAKAPQVNNGSTSENVNALDSQIVRASPATSELSEKSRNSSLASKILRAIVIPELTKEVNENKNFAQLRQVYNSLILATWYKKKIKNSILAQIYDDKNKIQGLSPTRGHVPLTEGKGYVSPSTQYTSSVIPAKAGIQNKVNSDMDPRFRGDDNKKDDVEAIYQRYLKAFKKGVYNYIKEDVDPATQETIPRKYFSGGVELIWPTDKAMTIVNKPSFLQNVLLSASLLFSVGCQVLPYTAGSDQAMGATRLDTSGSINSASLLEDSTPRKISLQEWKNSSLGYPSDTIIWDPEYSHGRYLIPYKNKGRNMNVQGIQENKKDNSQLAAADQAMKTEEPKGGISAQERQRLLNDYGISEEFLDKFSEKYVPVKELAELPWFKELPGFDALDYNINETAVFLFPSQLISIGNWSKDDSFAAPVSEAVSLPEEYKLFDFEIGSNFRWGLMPSTAYVLLAFTKDGTIIEQIVNKSAHNRMGIFDSSNDEKRHGRFITQKLLTDYHIKTNYGVLMDEAHQKTKKRNMPQDPEHPWFVYEAAWPRADGKWRHIWQENDIKTYANKMSDRLNALGVDPRVAEAVAEDIKQHTVVMSRWTGAILDLPVRGAGWLYHGDRDVVERAEGAVWGTHRFFIMLLSKLFNLNTIFVNSFKSHVDLISAMYYSMPGILERHGLNEPELRKKGFSSNDSDIPLVVPGQAGDRAMKGGIDLTPDNMHLQTKVMDSRFRGNDSRVEGNDNGQGGIKFHLDPAMLAQLQNVPGFVPVIINIQPLKSLQEFLGLKEDPANQSTG